MADVKPDMEHTSEIVDNVFMNLLIDKFKKQLTEALEFYVQEKIVELVESAARSLDVEVIGNVSFEEQARMMKFVVKFAQMEFQERARASVYRNFEERKRSVNHE